MIRSEHPQGLQLLQAKKKKKTGIQGILENSEICSAYWTLKALWGPNMLVEENSLTSFNLQALSRVPIIIGHQIEVYFFVFFFSFFQSY